MTAWSIPVRLNQLSRGPEVRTFEPDEALRAAIARDLGVAGLPAFSGEVRAAPWHDGVEIHGRWTARVTYICGVSLEPYEESLAGQFTVQAVPSSSPLAEPPDPEVELDLEAPDPPDVLDGETVDLGGYLVEHLALELDPFPRKPGAVFEPPEPEGPESPFAVLRRLKE
jgi:hypothetical protein